MLIITVHIQHLNIKSLTVDFIESKSYSTEFQDRWKGKDFFYVNRCDWRKLSFFRKMIFNCFILQNIRAICYYKCGRRGGVAVMLSFRVYKKNCNVLKKKTGQCSSRYSRKSDYYGAWDPGCKHGDEFNKKKHKATRSYI